MIFGYFTLFVALIISAVAAYYSIVGLTAIFSAAVIPILIMGASLEIGKVTAAIWLKINWHRANIMYKFYLVPAVAFLMLLTSMGIFGFLSKAHSDQSLVSGDSMAKVAIYDEKIRISKENIEANRKALKQMDEAVDQVMGRSADEKGADKAVGVRRSQQKERARLQFDIAAEQKTITTLGEESAPLRAEFRKIENEVGPIKYIAALVYGDNPDNNVLEKAVRLVIIMIVLVFDPLALVLILAAQQSIKWSREEQQASTTENIDPPKEIPAPAEPLVEENKDTQADVNITEEAPKQDPYLPGWMFDQHPYLTKPFVHFSELKPMPSRIAEYQEPAYEQDDGSLTEEQIEQLKTSAEAFELPKGEIIVEEKLFPEESSLNLSLPDEVKTLDEETKILTMDIDVVDHSSDHAMPEEVSKFPKIPETAKRVKAPNPIIPEATNVNKILSLQADNTEGIQAKSDFGTRFPDSADKGDMFLRVDHLPNKLFKFNGQKWIEVDKSRTDSYTYDEQYIQFLIEKLQSGEYDIDQLSAGEQELVAEKLKQLTNDQNT